MTRSEADAVMNADDFFDRSPGLLTAGSGEFRGNAPMASGGEQRAKQVIGQRHIIGGIEEGGDRVDRLDGGERISGLRLLLTPFEGRSIPLCASVLRLAEV